jgi:hypothetical protein
MQLQVDIVEDSWHDKFPKLNKLPLLALNWYSLH